MNTKRKLSLTAFLGTFVVVLLFAISLNAVYAYFTSTANKNITINFATLEVDLTESATSSMTDKITGVMPGDTLDFTDVKIANTGTADAYTLINLDVVIHAEKPLIYNEWFNIAGEKVNVNNFEINNVGADYLQAGSEQNLGLKWKVPGDPITNDYQNANIDVTLSNYSIQTYLPDSKAYVSEQLYASYFICKNVNKIYDQFNNLIRFPYNHKDTTTQGVSYKVFDDGSISVEGTSTQYAAFYLDDTINFKPNTTYSAKIDILEGTIDRNCYLMMHRYNGDGTSNYIKIAVSGNGISTFTLSEGQSVGVVYIQCTEGYPQSGRIKPYIFEGAYNEFKPTTEPLMRIAGNNLFNIEDFVNYQHKLVDNGTLGNKEKIATMIFDSKKCMYVAPHLMYNSQYYYFPVECKENKVYTLTYKGNIPMPDKDSSVQSTGLKLWYTDGSSQQSNFLLDKTGWQEITVISAENKTIAGIAIFYNHGRWAYYTDIHLAEGNNSTDYTTIEDIYNDTTGFVTRNIKKVELTGQESWMLSANYYQASLNLGANINNRVNSISNRYDYGDATDEKCFWIDSSGNGLRIKDGKFETVNDLRNYLAEEYAKGTPVTIWYQLATPTEEKVLTSKNLYEGKQNLYYETNGEQNCSQAGSISIKKDATKDLTIGVQELGGELFDYLYDKPFVISLKIRRYADDNVTNPKIGLRLDDVGGNSIFQKTSFENEIFADEQWKHIWLRVPCVKDKYSTTARFTIWMADYGTPTNRHFEIKDIQIELGSYPTDFEDYDPTEYARVNGTILRQVNGVADTYNPETRIITQRIGVKVLDGTENWIAYNASGEELSFQLNLNDSKIGFQTSVCNMFENYDEAWKYENRLKVGIYSDHNIYARKYFRPPNAAITSLEQWKAWLAEQCANGNSLTLWYQLATPVQVQI